MLQHVLATAQCSEVAGLTNVEWDAVNISSELMAMWLVLRKKNC
jgi:Zn-dependent oligopeptidase